MLHILWMILKFILIVIGILLGLLVLAVLLLLFCPVCYRAQASGNLEEWKMVKGSASVSWLFRGIILTLHLEDGKTSRSIRIFGIPLDKMVRRHRSSGSSGKTSSGKKENSSGKKIRRTEHPVKSSEETDKVKTEKLSEQKNESKSIESTDLKENVQDKNQTEVICGTKQSKEKPTDTVEIKQRKDSVRSETSEKQKKDIFKNIRNKISDVSDKLKQIPAVTDRFRNGIQSVSDKIDNLRQFLQRQEVREGLAFAWERIRHLLKHILPVRLEGNVTFGCEDPSVTGTVLGILGMTIPFHRNCIEVHPLFEGRNYLEGEVKLRGRIYGIVPIVTAVRIYFNKNIKYIIGRWKHKEESL